MSSRDPGPTPSKIVVSDDDHGAKKRAAPRGEKTRSWVGIVACAFPMGGLAVSFFFGGMLGGGNPDSRYFTLGVLTLLFILGAGAGLALGVLLDSRRKKLAPLIAIFLNGLGFVYVVLLALFPPAPEPPQEFETLTPADSVSVTTLRPGIGG